MRYFLGLGANVGDRLDTLRRAVRALSDLGQVAARSRIYETAPLGVTDQPGFLNAAVTLDSALQPLDLLRETQRIEAAGGRDRSREARWGPRTLDVDLLLAGARGEVIVDEPTLRLPHPRLHERGFALAPLIDLDATLVHPELRQPLVALVDAARAAGQAWTPTADALA
ncbi:MAG TPA: 2-amino-4-hydroxy-6-hydroxymethyldihydropteridine diphosphokinase [Polyangia bacterium]|nr:2-amino-4-hydroxy-6-hydroxymethyldihydropteridine diphosphokinase [Polyangia bacterium]